MNTLIKAIILSFRDYIIQRIIHLVSSQNFLNSWHFTSTRAYQGVRNVTFFGKFWERAKWMIRNKQSLKSSDIAWPTLLSTSFYLGLEITKNIQ